MKRPLHKQIGHHARRFHGHFTKYLYERDTIFATIWVFIFIVVLGLIPLNFYVLNPMKQALKDFDFSDMVYSKLGKNKDVNLDNRIVIINIGTKDREGIAQLIEKAASMNPKVMGLDVTFDGPRDPQKDSILSEVINQNKNLVLANQVIYGEGTTVEKIEKGYFGYVSHKQGFVNMVSKDNQSVRLFHPIEVANSKTYKNFACAVAEEYDPAAVAYLEKRHKDLELINYTRRLRRQGDDAIDKESKAGKEDKDQYLTIEPDVLLSDNVDTGAIKGKIVLLGYVNRDPDDIIDKKFTPLNKRYAGKSIPDMNGVVVHANTISMILDKNYIKKLPSWVNWLVAILVCWLHMSFFIRYYLENHIWFHLVAKIAQVASAFFFVYLGIYVFDRYRVKLDMKMTLVVIIMAVDVIYFYEAWATWMHKKYKYHTVFKPHHH